MEKASKWLVITEKPSVAGDLAKALGGFEKKATIMNRNNTISPGLLGIY